MIRYFILHNPCFYRYIFLFGNKNVMKGCIYTIPLLHIAELTEIQGAQYLLNRYITLGPSEPIVKNVVRYTIQRYQGKHKNEFLVRSQTGDVFLYENNVLKQRWRENERGKKSEEFIAYKNGRVDFRQRFDDITEQTDFYRIVNHNKGLRMEITSLRTGLMMYHGEVNENHQREGWGIEYDEESGKMVVEGMWSKGVLKEVIRCFNEDTMTELIKNGADSLDPTKRIPIYVGGFRYDEDNERFIREGKGCLIDEKTGIATRECEWKEGKEVSGRDLYDGWYNPKSKYAFPTITIPRPARKRKFVPDLLAEINESHDYLNLSLQVTDLTISSNCCNDLTDLNLNDFEFLRSVKIGDDCFGLVKSLKIEGLYRLKSLRIGSNSFTQVKQPEWDQLGHAEAVKRCSQSKSFHILNCNSLESIEIGEYSFVDYAGDFELNNLMSLKSITLGTIGQRSFNFYYGSFVIRGIDMTLVLYD